MKRILAVTLLLLVGCATTQSVTTFISEADMTRMAAAACSGHQGVQSVNLQLTYALVSCRDGAMVTVEYFPAPEAPKVEVK